MFSGAAVAMILLKRNAPTCIASRGVVLVSDLDPLGALRTVEWLPVSDPAHSFGIAISSVHGVHI